MLLPAFVVGAAMFLARKRAARANSPDPPGDNGPYAAIDAYIEQHRRRLNIPGVSLAIVAGDQIVHARGFGQAHPGGAAPSPRTPFFIGSLTKSFTALAILQLAEGGQVELDAPVQRYLPWFRVADAQASAEVTVRHLLNQTSGLPQLVGIFPLADFDAQPGAGERQARALATLKFTRPVGSAWGYCNMNYNLLGLIVEAASGTSYSDYIQQHIFAPLAMDHTYTCLDAAKQNGLARGHQYWFAAPIAVPHLPVPQGSLPSGQLISCAHDLARYLIAHLNAGRCGDTQILSPAGIAELHRPAVAASELGLSWGRYAMGWFVDQLGQKTLLSHSGTVPDFFAFMALLPEQSTGVVLLVNANHLVMNGALAEVGRGVAALLAEQPPAPVKLGFIPWALRVLLLLPLLQIAGVAATLRRLRVWRRTPALRPTRGRLWGQHILLPLIPNLALAAIPVYLLVTKMFRFMRLFFPDVTWAALFCGGFAGVWAILRTRLSLRAVAPPSSSQAGGGQGVRPPNH